MARIMKLCITCNYMCIVICECYMTLEYVIICKCELYEGFIRLAERAPRKAISLGIGTLATPQVEKIWNSLRECPLGLEK